MIHITQADAQWLLALLKIVEEVYEAYPELFNDKDEEVLFVTGQFIRSIQ